MACFTVSLAEAIVVKVVQKKVAKKEKLAEQNHVSLEKKPLIPTSTRLGWLSNLLFGGSTLLALEHVWHGEVVPWFPFLTAAESAEETAEMLHEMSTVGVSMAVLVTAVWAGVVAVTSILEKKAKKQDTAIPEKN